MPSPVEPYCKFNRENEDLIQPIGWATIAKPLIDVEPIFQSPLYEVSYQILLELVETQLGFPFMSLS